MPSKFGDEVLSGVREGEGEGGERHTQSKRGDRKQRNTRRYTNSILFFM